MKKEVAIEQKKQESQKARMIFLTLIDASLNYRDTFREEDLESYDKAITEHVTKNNLHKNDREKVFQAGQQIKKLNTQYARQREQITEALAQEVQTALLGMAPEAQMGFKASANALQLLIEEFFKADSATNMIGVAKAYNNGAFKTMFEKTPAQKLEALKEELRNVSKYLEEVPEGADAEDVAKATAHKATVIEEINALEMELNIVIHDVTKEE